MQLTFKRKYPIIASCYLATVLLLSACMLVSCSQDDAQANQKKYEKALAEGLASQERTDKLFLGIRLGMRPQDFFDHCTDLNQQKIILEGNAGNTVRYAIPGMEHATTMNFFPKFTKSSAGHPAKLYAMDMEFSYDAWAPWNKEYYSLNLLKDVTKRFVDWYGEDFIAVPHPSLGRVVVQVKNNRRTAFWILNESTVRGRIVDLTVVPEEPLVPVGIESPVFSKDSLAIQHLLEEK